MGFVQNHIVDSPKVQKDAEHSKICMTRNMLLRVAANEDIVSMIGAASSSCEMAGSFVFVRGGFAVDCYFCCVV